VRQGRSDYRTVCPARADDLPTVIAARSAGASDSM
jgi:hypothetical protein